MKIYKNNEYPKRAKDLKGNDEEFSVDVITYNIDQCLDIAFWDYDDQKWMFHTETLCDPYEGDNLIDFVWMYKPKELQFSWINKEKWDKQVKHI